MFIRKTKTRTTDEGVEYFSYRLVDSSRVAGKVRQRTLLNLGSHFAIPQSQWPELCQRIEQLLYHQPDLLLELDEPLEREAESIVGLLLRNQSDDRFPSGTIAASGKEESSVEGDLQRVDIDTIQVSDARSCGGEWLALSAMQEVGLMEQLQEIGFNRNQMAAAVGNIVGRMVQPGSELSTHEWLQHNSALGELLGIEYEKMGLSALYRASDLLWSKHEEIEHFLYQRHQRYFALEEQITLYDLTNTFFEGSGKYNEHAAYGHSKERRNDCLLVTLAVVLDGSGFSRRSRIFAGNVGEPTTLQQMIGQLRSTADAGKKGEEPSVEMEPMDLQSPPTIVMDAGIASQENIEWLEANGYRYIVVSRKRQMSFDEEAAVTVKERENDTVRAYRVERDNGEIELYCHSRRKELKEQSMTDRASSRFEAELKHLAEGLHLPRRTKGIKAVCEKLGRLKQQYSSVARYYEIRTEQNEKQQKVTALHYQRIELRQSDPNTHPGVYCLRSNQREWSEQQLWSTYTMLTDLEAVFRSLKSELGMRPIFHQKTHRVEGHIFITLLAYNLIHQLRLRLKAQGINDGWSRIRTTMSTQQRVTITLRGEHDSQIHVRQSHKPNAGQKRILKALHIPELVGERSKTVVRS